MTRRTLLCSNKFHLFWCYKNTKQRERKKTVFSVEIKIRDHFSSSQLFFLLPLILKSFVSLEPFPAFTQLRRCFHDVFAAWCAFTQHSWEWVIPLHVGIPAAETLHGQSMTKRLNSRHFLPVRLHSASQALDSNYWYSFLRVFLVVLVFLLEPCCIKIKLYSIHLPLVESNWFLLLVWTKLI